MKYTLQIWEDIEEPEWSAERFWASNDYYHIVVSGDDEEEVVNALKGTILCAVGQRQVVPDVIEFVVERT